ncbi:hypothetical protein [Ruania albidiflava]|uniref:hypothetical protein n=1 Tax=Ruania albidiflava TaxID=366586 RepID=UPI0003B49F3D|nr:hypothetical protein [Ruania albidiflava]
MSRWWRARWARATSGSEDEGQILLLSLVFGVLTLTLVLVVASVSAIYLERKELLALADALAADAADAVDAERYYTDPGVDHLPLTDASVHAAVQEYLAAAPAAVTDEFEAFAVVPPTGTPDGSVAEVTLSARVRPPVLPWVLMPWADGFPVEVTARGVAR